MTTPYTTGTITLTNGSAVVTGAGTAWQTALIVGGIIYAEAAGGNSMPILTVDSDTQITAAVKWKGATGSYSYALVIDTAYDRQVLANATALAQILQALQKPSISALSSLTPANNKLPWFSGANTAALADFTVFARTLLDDADASTALTTLGVSTFIKTLLDDADASTALGTLGVSDYAKTLLDDATASDALSTLGVSTYIKGLLDDSNQAAARTTLGAQAALGFTPINKAGDTVTGPLDFTMGPNAWHQRAANPITLAANGGNLAIQTGAGLVLIGEDLSAGGSALFLLSQTSSVKISDPGGYYSATVGNNGTINIGYLSGTGMIVNNGRAAAVTVKTIMFQTRTAI